MKIYASLSNHYEHKLPLALVDKVQAVLPQGVAYERLSVSLPEDDERLKSILRILEEAGYEITWRGKKTKETELSYHRWRVYDPSDLVANSHFLLCPHHMLDVAAHMDDDPRDDDRIVVLQKWEESNEEPYGSPCDGIHIVSQELADAITQANMTGVIFKPTRASKTKTV